MLTLVMFGIITSDVMMEKPQNSLSSQIQNFGGYYSCIFCSHLVSQKKTLLCLVTSFLGYFSILITI